MPLHSRFERLASQSFGCGLDGPSAGCYFAVVNRRDRTGSGRAGRILASGRGTHVVLIALGVALGRPAAAHAYLDPGTGSVMLQLLLGGVASVAVLLRLLWHRIRRGLGLAPGPEKSASSADESGSAGAP